MSIAGVVLAAGASKRLGRPKQRLNLAGETLLERTVRVASEAGLAPLIVVLARNMEIGDALPQHDCDVVLNGEADEGLASSIRWGVARAAERGASGAVLMACDQIALTADHLRSLSCEIEIVRGSRYAGKIGVPAYFPASSFPELLLLAGDTGASHLLRHARSIENEALSLDIDTEADVELAKQYFAL
jgi:molybdenum cofactor cytidylyltransferase